MCISIVSSFFYYIFRISGVKSLGLRQKGIKKRKKEFGSPRRILRIGSSFDLKEGLFRRGGAERLLYDNQRTTGIVGEGLLKSLCDA